MMIDPQPADAYGVSAKSMNLAVRRNGCRFPGDLMLLLSAAECEQLRNNLRLQFETLNQKRHDVRRYIPFTFTEQGVALPSGVLRRERAIQVNIAITRVFIKLREMFSIRKELTAKLNEIEIRLEKHDERVGAIFRAISGLTAPPPQKPTHPIGFGRE